MEKLKKLFAKIQSKKPALAAYPCLVDALAGRQFSDDEIINAFQNLIPRADFFRADEENLLQYLLRYSADR